MKSDHRQPTDPWLRELAERLRNARTNCNAELEAFELEEARNTPAALRVGVLQAALSSVAQSDAKKDEREAAAAIAFALMQVHQLAVHSPSTGEAIAICPGCGEVEMVHAIEGQHAP